ncbi:DNA/RNA non-specific endonuclease [Chitinibacter fontanus]|uniref:Endonuclease n=1 Tax=Chitinibacter fontanus TaxID=1737446 RepID=A0A7D5VBA3_9NEIS|nr:DNA/RNA non-specific endonuclease [Chitinibacter fontanus]QLI82655.1 DNA/RNA non-specific endonuclease [Chitinibacter fontanus]
MKFPLVISVALATASFLHFNAEGRHITQQLLGSITQLQHAIPNLNPNPASTNSTRADAGAFKECPQFFYNNTPPTVINAAQWKPRALCMSGFAVYHSGLTRTPLFVAERLSRASLQDAQDEQRTNRFYAEARLPLAERATLEDYKGSGYDRGHMAPAADMSTSEAMAQSFSLANMVPQAPENNRGVWAKSVEKAVRKYAMRAKGDVYVITGPYFEGHRSADSSVNNVWVPSALYKLVYDPAAGKSWAYWVENKNDAKLNGVISYQTLVERTGIHFLPSPE